MANSLVNFRDLSLLNKSAHLSKGVIFRGSNLFNADLKAIETIKSNNIKTIIDLRCPYEINTRPDVRIDGVTYLNIPILSDNHMGITDEIKKAQKDTFLEDMLKNRGEIEYQESLYVLFAEDEFCLRGFSQLIKSLAYEVDYPVMFHCSRGKDRAGIASYIICKTLGANEADLTEDYIKSAEILQPYLEKEVEEISKSIHSPHLEEVYYNLFSVLPSYLNAFKTQVDKNYGNFATFIKNGLKLNEKDLSLFKSKFSKR
ncbi:MAG: tyrosine-protein phosphatase [Firmicutes bacterium]|uniref:Tyrosine-protein phosphatase n=1 Tax=Candidatus Scatoplasma merdavium TaxID=2840932 RepID=A0A9D9D7H0_9BACL|nr:tyrosine-protein phosphatase [Candidatus Scatoplasma merdavium]